MVSSLQFELLDHWLTPEAEEEVVCCQCRHGVAGTVGGTSNMGKDHCRKRIHKKTHGQRELNKVKNIRDRILTAVFEGKERVL